MPDNRVDVLLTRIGTGKWNIFHVVASAIASGLPAPHAFAGAFVVPRLHATCRTPMNNEDGSTHFKGNISNSCHYMLRTTKGDVEEHPCTEWDFDNSTFTRTITSEFDLVCQKEYVRALYMSLYMIGVLVASPTIGSMADRFGRKTTFVTGMLAFVFLSFLSGWLPNIPSLLACRFFIGLTHVPVVKISFILGVEAAPPSLRPAAGILMYLPFSFFAIVLGGLAYQERDWRWLLTYTSFISLAILPTLWFIDESPHWLAVRGQYGRALQVLKKAARWNNSSLPPDEEVISLLKGSADEAPYTKTIEVKKSWWSTLKEHVKDLFILFRTPRLRIISAVMHLSFFVIDLVYYGLAFNGSNYKINVFAYMCLLGLVEMPGRVIMFYIVKRFGRKIPLVISLILTGVVLLSIAFIPTDLMWVVVAMVLFGRMNITAASSVNYLYGSELFPTEVRTRGISYSFMMSRVGSSIAPFITEYLGYAYQWAPSVVFGGLSVVAGLASMALWETKGLALPDTIAFLESNDPRTSNERILKWNRKGSKEDSEGGRVGRRRHSVTEEQMQLKPGV